ncbi:hypothetical protein ACFC3A_14085, partial [Enterococcus thailandicus]
QNILINDSFVAYIALHFLVSYEREEDLRSVRAVYICSTGLGVTSLIKQKINEELNNITIVAFASVLNAQEMIATKDPDLVISIFPINGRDKFMFPDSLDPDQCKKQDLFFINIIFLFQQLIGIDLLYFFDFHQRKIMEKDFLSRC